MRISGRRKRALLAGTALVSAALLAPAAASADVCIYSPIIIYEGVVDQQTGNLVSASGSFSDPNVWFGKAQKLDNVPCAVGSGPPLAPGPGDAVGIGPLTSTLGPPPVYVNSFTVSNVGGRVGGLTVFGGGFGGGGGTITLQLAGVSTVGMLFNGGGVQLNGSASADAEIAFLDGDPALNGHLDATVAGGTLSAADIVQTGGDVHIASSGVLSAERVVIDGGLTPTMAVDGKVKASQYLTVGNHSDGFLGVTTGAEVTSVNGYIGGFDGSSGIVSMTGGKWTLSGNLRVGDAGTGELLVGSGSKVDVGDNLFVGSTGKSSGTLDITGGGVVTAKSGAPGPTSAAIVLGVNAGTTGTVTISGAGSKLESQQSMVVGFDGTGQLDVKDGGELKIDGSIFRIGRDKGAVGTVNLVGAASNLTFGGDTFHIGRDGTGTLNLSQGFQLNSGAADVTVGVDAGSDGTVTLKDAATLWSLGGNLIIGDAGTGRVTVQSAGLTLQTGKTITLGKQASGDGTLTFNGNPATAPQQALETMVIGDQGRGTLALKLGALITLKSVELGKNAGATGHVLVDGSSGGSGPIGDPAVPSTLTVDAITVGGQGTGLLDVTGGAQLVVNGISGDNPEGMTVQALSQKGSGVVTVSGAGSLLDASKTAVIVAGADGGSGELDVKDGGQVKTLVGGVGGASVGDGGYGALTVDGANSIFSASFLKVSDRGDISVTGGGLLTFGDDMSMGAGSTPSATATLTVSGAGSRLAVTGPQYAGDATVGPQGILTIEAGASAKVTELTVDGSLSSAPGGAVTVDGAGSSLTMENGEGNSTLQLGRAAGLTSPATLTVSGGAKFFGQQVLVGGSFDKPGSGVLNVSGGAEVSITSADLLGVLFIAPFAGSTGVVNVSSGGKIEAADAIGVGLPAGQDSPPGGRATMSVTDGSVSTQLLGISGAGNAVTASGPTTRLTLGRLVLNGGAQLTLAEGAEAQVSSRADVGAAGSAPATVTVTSGATFSAGTLNVGAVSAGVVSVAGGSVVAPSVVIASAAGSSGSAFSLAGANSSLLAQSLMVKAGGSFALQGGATAQINTLVETFTNGAFDVRGGKASLGAIGLPAKIGTLLIGPGGTLKGNTIAGNVVNKGGIVSPGHSPGTLTIQGDYTQEPGSTLLISLGPTDYSRLAVTGTATIDGGALQFQPVDGGQFQYGKSYSVLTAAGGTSGDFSAVSVAQPAGLPFIDLTSSFVGGVLVVTAIHMPNSFGPLAQSPNQHAVAAALDAAAPVASGTLNDEIGALSFAKPADVVTSLDPLSGEAYGNFATLGIQNARTFTAAARGAALQTAGAGERVAFGAGPARQQLAALDTDAGGPGLAGAPAQPTPSVWLAADGRLARASGNGGAHTMTSDAAAIAGGLDVRPTPHWAAGAAIGFSSTSLRDQGISDGRLTSYELALYGGYAHGPLYVDAVAGYARSSAGLMRSLGPAAPVVARGRLSADQYFLSAEAGYDAWSHQGWRLTPYVDVDGGKFNQGAFTETGAAQLGLDVAGRRTTSVRTTLGLGVSRGGWTAGDMDVSVSARAGWGHEFADVRRPVSAAFIGAPGVPFTVQAPAAAADAAVAALGLSARSARGLEVYARVDADLASSAQSEEASLGASWRW
jgi:T5SS/PEP-CTERM-associated repeat protein